MIIAASHKLSKATEFHRNGGTPTRVSFIEFVSAAISFEVFFILFILAGVYKADERLASFPIDLTLFFLILSMGAASCVLIQRGLRFYRRALAFSVCFFFFLSWMVITLSWSPSRMYGPAKATQLVTLTLWAGIAPAFIIGPDPVRFRRFAISTLVVVSLLSIDGFINYLQGKGAIFVSENYLNTGRAAGVGAMIALGLFSTAQKISTRFCLGILLGLFLFVLWVNGGRGPLLGVGVGAAVLGMASVRWRDGRLRLRIPQASGLAAICVMSAVVVIALGPESATLRRFNVLLTEENGGRSAGSRLHYYEETLKIIDEAPLLGVGLGGWPLAAGYTDVKRHPHNILLETFSEGGAIGLILLLITIGISLRMLFVYRAFERIPQLIVLLLFVNASINAFTSSDLSENRLFFTFLGLMTIATARQDQVWGHRI